MAMRHENIVTPVTSKSEGDEGKRNRKTRIFSALLSASALGVFLEGCGGADTGSGSGTSGAEASGVGALATSSAVTFAGSTDIVSEGSAGTVSEDSTYIDNPISSAHAEPDFFTGFAAANIFSALIFSGFSVDDTLMRGADTLQGDANVDTFAGGAGADIIDGRAGADILNGGADADTILGGDGNDTMHGDTDADTLRGGKGGDTMYGGAGADILLGGDGDDTMHGDAGADTYMFNAGDGTDTITDNGGRLVFLQGANRVYAGATYTFVYGQGEAVTLTVSKNGSTLNVIEFTSDPLNYDFFTRSGSIDTPIPARLLVVPLRVGSEETPFVATADADIFAGSEIYNWVSYAESDEGVTIDLSPVAPATATVSGGWARGDTLTAIHNLIGSSLADTLIGNGADNNFRGGEGADTLNGGAGEGDTASYEFAKEGVRVTFALTGEQQSDFDGTHGFAANNNEAVGDILTDIEHIKGSNFNDWLTGDALKNILRGLGGNDRLEGGGDNDELYGGAGEDYLVGGDGDDRLFGHADNDILYGYDGNDIIRGGTGDDLLDGDAGNDELYGGEGDDTLVGDEGEDILDGGAGTDTVAYQYVGGGIRVSLARTEAQIDFDGTHGFNANDNDAVGDTLANIENIRGSNFADWLTGDDNDNKIQGETGNDRLDGGAGADTYLFGAGDGTDTIADDGGTIVFLQGTGNAYAGATYTFVGGQGDAVTLTVRDSNSNTLNIIEFTSYPSGYSFSTRVYAGDGSYTDTAIDPTLLVLPPRLGSEENPFVATDAPDTFVALQGADWVNYAGSEDGITIYLNDDPIYASDGWADGDELSGINNLIGSDEEDDLVGNSADNIIRGGDGDDTITGEEGEDTLQGGDGNDRLQGNEGADTIDGGAGTKDIATYGNSSGKGVRVSLLLQGQRQIDFDSTHGFTANGNEAVGDTLTNIENLEGSSYNDWLTGDNNDNEIHGRNGNDRLEGNAGNDALYGNFNDDALYGGEGDDFLEGGLGADILDGGEGEDTAYYDSYPPPTFRRGVRVDLSNTEAQQDFETNSFGFNANDNEAVGDVLTNIENIEGSRLNDWLTGNYQNNILRGLAGNDRLEGGMGADTLYGGAGADTLEGGIGNDELYGDAGTDTLEGGVGADTLYGGAGADTLEGEVGADTLYGDAGADTLEGGMGNDELYGGAGADTLVGGADADTYIFRNGDGTDTISDDGEDNNIVFLQGTGNAYAGATYTFVGGQGEAVTLTVRDSNSNTLNIIEFTSYPSGYSFSTRVYAGDGSYTDTAIDPTLLVLPARLGSEENPFVATDDPDTFAGSEGADWVNYAGSEAGVKIYLSDDPIYADSGWADGDELSGINNLIGSNEADLLVGNGADNILRGGGGNDAFYGGDGADTIDGGEGRNFVFYQSAGNGVRVDLTLAGAQQDFEEENGFTANDNEAVGDILINIENIVGSDHNDWLTGNDNDNGLIGGTGDDRIDSGGGDDIILGDLGADTIDGGAGEDTVSYSDSGKGVRVSLLLQGQAQQDFETNNFGFTANDNEAVDDILTNIENLFGSRRDDWLTGDANNNELFGYADNDRLEGGAGDDTYAFNAGDGTDTIIDDGGNIVFDQGINGDYTGATYTYTRADGGRGEAVTLTVRNSSNTTINVLKFAGDPSSSYTFYTRVQAADGSYTDTAITLPAVLARLGSEGNPFVATADPDTFVALAGADWASYAGSTAGVSIELDDNNPATLSGGWAAGDTLTNINNLIGSDHADSLSGNGADNILRGGLGADTLEGGAGADILDGGADADEVSYSNSGKGVRVDLALAGAQQDFETNSFGFTANDNEAVNDIISNIENITGSDYNDWLAGDDNANTLYGLLGNDRLEGGADADTLDGGLGADTLVGGADADTYIFRNGDGTDTIIDDGGAIVFVQGTSNDYAGATYTYTRADGGRGEAVTLTVYKDGNTLNVLEFASDPSSSYTFYTRSSDGTDTAITLPAVPVRLGSEENPFVATDATDIFVALQGADWASYAGSTAGVTIELDDNNPATLSGGWAAGDALTNINNLIGSDHADSLSGNGADNILRGGLGADILEGGAGADTLDGGADADEVSYSNSGKGVRVDLALAGAQQDFETNSFGFTANDNEAVGDILSNIENILGSSNNDWLTGDGNANRLVGGTGDDRLEGGDDNDELYGGAGDDALYGDAGFDTLDGGLGADTLDGGDDTDEVSYSNSGKGVRVDLTLAGAQQDFEAENGFTANNNEAEDDILTNIENIRGSDYNDWLAGDDNANTLYGLLGNDRLEGGADADTLDGGLGADTLVGGADADTYIFRNGDGTDTIIDDGGAIVFVQGTNNDYVGATYTYTRADGGRGEAVTLTVRDSSSNTLNVLEFASDPSSSYTFYTRSSDGTDTAITLSAVPARLGSEENPFLATNFADIFVALQGADWASYAGSTAGVTIELDDNNPATLSGGWATGDTLTNINNLIGSDHADTLSGNGADNILRGGLGADILEGGAGADILEGGAGKDDYVFDANSGDDTIKFDADGGRLLFRDTESISALILNRNVAGDVTLSLAGKIITIDDSGTDDAYQQGSYSVHDGAADTFFVNIYIGENNIEDTIKGSGDADLIVGLANNDFLYGEAGNDRLDGGAGNDQLYGGANNDRLDGGAGNDRLDGGSGADKYIFDANDGLDTISSSSDGLGNKLVFRAQPGNPYADANFAFAKGNVNAEAFLNNPRNGEDLRIIVSSGAKTINTVYIEDYFTQTNNNAYTIYRTTFGSQEDGQIVSTMGFDETS